MICDNNIWDSMELSLSITIHDGNPYSPTKDDTTAAFLQHAPRHWKTSEIALKVLVTWMYMPSYLKGTKVVVSRSPGHEAIQYRQRR